MDSVFCEQTDPGDEVTEPGSEEYSDNEYGVGITLDTTVLDNVGQVHTSLTDHNGIALFTNEYEESVRLSTEEARRIRQDEVNLLFLRSTICSEDKYQHVLGDLFIYDEEQIVRQESSLEKGTDRTVILFVAILAIIVVATISIINKKKHREKAKHESDIYTYD